MQHPTIPELESHCGSWIASTTIDGEARIRETFGRTTAEALAARGWLVETAAQYLGRYNRAVKVAADRRAALAAFDAEYMRRD
jgi:hypothetical protein